MEKNTNIGRRKIAVFIDYSLRIPNFNTAYEAFKADLFSDRNFGVTFEDEVTKNDLRSYWSKQLEDPKIEAFYVSKKVPTSNVELRGNFDEYFFNSEHLHKFIDDYSYNIYVDTQMPNPQDVEVINIAQELLFEVVLIDEYYSKRKKSNTLFYLSKIRAYPQSVIFLGNGQRINEENYFGIWNPRTDPSQVNKVGDKTFIEWLKTLEAKQRELDNAKG